jgi:hypothetical protein
MLSTWEVATTDHIGPCAERYSVMSQRNGYSGPFPFQESEVLLRDICRVFEFLDDLRPASALVSLPDQVELRFARCFNNDRSFILRTERYEGAPETGFYGACAGGMNCAEQQKEQNEKKDGRFLSISSFHITCPVVLRAPLLRMPSLHDQIFPFEIADHHGNPVPFFTYRPGLAKMMK